jgi:hypothetical protein
MHTAIPHTNPIIPPAIKPTTKKIIRFLSIPSPTLPHEIDISEYESGRYENINNHDVPFNTFAKEPT